MTESDTLVHALVGAVVAVVLAFVPFSPALGGAVAGYLERKDGARVGGIAGALSAIPLLLLVALAFAVVSFLTIAPTGMPRGALVVAAFLALALLFVAAYTVGLGALGGVLGVIVADHYDERRAVDAADTARDRP